MYVAKGDTTNGVREGRKQILFTQSASITTLMIMRTFAKEKTFSVELGGSRAERLGGCQSWGPALALSFTSCRVLGGTLNFDVHVFWSVRRVYDNTNLSGRHGRHRMAYVECFAQCSSGIGRRSLNTN